MSFTRKKLAIWAVLFLCVIGIAGLYDYFTKAEAVVTSTPSAVDEWEEIAQNGVREGDTKNISANYVTKLYIDVAISNATAHTGTKIWVQVSAATTLDEDWYTFTEFIGPIGTVNLEALSGAEAAGQTVLEVASTLGLYDDDEARWLFLEDNVVANSEMCLAVSAVGNTSVTVQDPLTNSHDASDVLNDIAKNYVIHIPMGHSRVRVIYDNTYDSNGATVHTKCRISQVTGL